MVFLSSQIHRFLCLELLVRSDPRWCFVLVELGSSNFQRLSGTFKVGVVLMQGQSLPRSGALALLGGGLGLSLDVLKASWTNACFELIWCVCGGLVLLVIQIECVEAAGMMGFGAGGF
ncbi:hypothetical protein ACOSQ2_028574 [Xanthoceras sorbifolium]